MVYVVVLLFVTWIHVAMTEKNCFFEIVSATNGKRV